MQELYIRLGARLRELRLQRGTSCYVVAFGLGVTPKAVTMYEIGMRRISMHLFVAYCELIEADPVALLAEALQEQPVPKSTPPGN